MNSDDGFTVSTLPVLTKCRFNADKKVEMVVVIRDGNNVIQANLTDDGHNILGVDHEAQPGGKCSITQSKNQLEYFKVRTKSHLS